MHKITKFTQKFLFIADLRQTIINSKKITSDKTEINASYQVKSILEDYVEKESILFLDEDNLQDECLEGLLENKKLYWHGFSDQKIDLAKIQVTKKVGKHSLQLIAIFDQKIEKYFKCLIPHSFGASVIDSKTAKKTSYRLKNVVVHAYLYYIEKLE